MPSSLLRATEEVGLYGLLAGTERVGLFPIAAVFWLLGLAHVVAARRREKARA